MKKRSGLLGCSMAAVIGFLWLLFILVDLAGTVAVVYVIYHFVSKYW